MKRKLTDRELATVLGALRVIEEDPSWHFRDLREFFTNAPPLSRHEINAFCELINTANVWIEE